MDQSWLMRWWWQTLFDSQDASTILMSSHRSRSRDSHFTANTHKTHRTNFSKLSRTSIQSGPLVFDGTCKVKAPKEAIQSEKQQFKLPRKVKEEPQFDQYMAFQWKEAEEQAEKLWYDQEQGELWDESKDNDKFYETQNTKKFSLTIEKIQAAKENFRTKQRNAQHSKWELNRLATCGLFKINLQSKLLQQQQQNRVVLIVHDLKPPFLDGKNNLSLKNQEIQIMKNPNSDMAVQAKRGSDVLKEFRDKNEKFKAKERFWQLAGSKMGKLIGIQKEKTQQPEINDDDYKEDAKFSTLLAKRNQAVSEFTRFKTLKQQREYLPIYEVRQELVRLISDHRVVIIVGQTGSGKTTQLTQFLFQEGYCSSGSIIGCTQPRRVAAVSVAKRVAQQMSTQLGNRVGYSIRFEDCTSVNTKIKYMTDGVLLRESLNDPDLERYSAIIMDEAHQRSLNTDVLFGIIKKVAQKRRDIRLIVTSATMNADRFSAFFGGAPIYTIPGRTFPVQLIYEKGPAHDYVDAAVKKCIQVHLQQPAGDILIFMTGQEDITATCSLIHQKLEKIPKAPTMLVLPIYSQLRSEDQAKIFQSSEHRKCIVATNIAQTSLTLDGVKYVIDSGFCKLKVYNPRIGMDALQVTPISQANANQRSGRAGRTGPGTCHRLYTQTMFREDLFENNIPQIQRTNLSNVVLLLKSLKIQDVFDFDFMDPPPRDTILNSMYQLWILSALDNLGRLTELGKKMSEFPVDPPLSKMILIANDLGCLQEMLTVVSMISVPSIFFKPKEREQEAESARQKLIVPQSDHLTLLNVYQQWKKHDYSNQWATAHYLQTKSLRKVRQVRAQLKDIAKQLGLKMSTCSGNYDLVRKAICSGYFSNASKIKGIGDYVNLRSGMPCKLHPSSALFCLGYVPQYIVYHQLVMTSKQYMNCVTTVDPYWLAELGPMFFMVKSDFTKSRRELQKEGLNKMQMELQAARQLQQRESRKTEQKERVRKGLIAQRGEAVVRFGEQPRTPLRPV